MYALHLRNIYRKEPNDTDFMHWVICVPRGTGSKNEKVIHEMHKTLDVRLSEQDVNFTEITSEFGRREVWQKFNVGRRKHPLFLLFNTFPADCRKDDCVLLIEWGKWAGTDDFREDLIAFADLFTDRKFRTALAKAHDEKSSQKVIAFMKDFGISIIGIGTSVFLGWK